MTVDTCVEVEQDVLPTNLYSQCSLFIVHLIDIYSAPYTPTSPENTPLYPRNVFLTCQECLSNSHTCANKNYKCICGDYLCIWKPKLFSIFSMSHLFSHHGDGQVYNQDHYWNGYSVNLQCFHSRLGSIGLFSSWLQ